MHRGLRGVISFHPGHPLPGCDDRPATPVRGGPLGPQAREGEHVVNADRLRSARSVEREDPSLDFQFGPAEKAWDEEDGLFEARRSQSPELVRPCGGIVAVRIDARDLLLVGEDFLGGAIRPYHHARSECDISRRCLGPLHTRRPQGSRVSSKGQGVPVPSPRAGPSGYGRGRRARRRGPAYHARPASPTRRGDAASAPTRAGHETPQASRGAHCWQPAARCLQYSA